MSMIPDTRISYFELSKKMDEYLKLLDATRECDERLMSPQSIASEHLSGFYFWLVTGNVPHEFKRKV